MSRNDWMITDLLPKGSELETPTHIDQSKASRIDNNLSAVPVSAEPESFTRSTDRDRSSQRETQEDKTEVESETNEVESHSRGGAQNVSGKQLRDKGIAQVSDNNLTWMELCVRVAELLACNREDFTGEDIRFWCQSKIGLPRHHNAWGALTNVLIKRGIIEATGKHRPMKDEISHARSTPVYRKKL